MFPRQYLAVVNLGILVLAIFAEFEFPAYSNYVLVGLVVWFIATLVLFYGQPGRAAASGFGRPSASRGPGPPGSPPLPGSSGPATRLEFCVYCGTALAADTVTCPSCGKSVRAI
jgi:hypothetical protein